MPRILLLILLFWLVFICLKRLARYLKSTASQASSTAHNGNIVRCCQCGLYIPESESQTKAGRIYCRQPGCQSARDTHED